MTDLITIRKGHKFRIEPNAAQRELLSQFAGANRFVWNKCLRLNLDRIEAQKIGDKPKLMSFYEQSYWLTHIWKKSDELGWLNCVPRDSLQQTLMQLDRAMKDWFDKAQLNKRRPRFKKKGEGDSMRFSKPPKVDEKLNKIYLPKIGWVKYRNSRPLQGKAKNITVSRRGEHWYISVQTEQEIERPRHQSTTMVGIDMGVARFATLSDGTFHAPLAAFARHQKQLSREQRKLAKKVKFSNNWKKQKQKITRLHERIANTRNDYLHKVSTNISKSHAMIVLEDLRVKNMTKSAKGNAEQHGSNVKAKAGLNRSILDAGWGAFASMLEYKQDWAGGQVIKIDPKYTSQRCPKCGHVSKKNRISQALFKCTACGYAENADLVGAKNILAAGHAVLACGEAALATSAKQEYPAKLAG